MNTRFFKSTLRMITHEFQDNVLVTGLPIACPAEARVVWQVMTTAGPWHARLLALGVARSAKLQTAFFDGKDSECPVVHHPRARLLVLRRTKAAL